MKTKSQDLKLYYKQKAKGRVWLPAGWYSPDSLVEIGEREHKEYRERPERISQFFKRMKP